MKRSSMIFLQTFVVLIGTAVIIFLLWEPHIEGRNAHATLYAIYFKDPFLAWAYIASLFFFMAIYQVFQLFGAAGRNEVYTQRSLRALRIIKVCGTVLLGFIAVGETYLFIMVKGKDDIAGGVAMGILVGLISAAMTAAAAAFERNIKIRMS